MNLSKRDLIFALVIVVLLILVSLSFFLRFDNNGGQDDDDFYLLFENESSEVQPENESTEVELRNFVVDVKGAVRLPGVYEVIPGMRVINAIELAGGLIEGANENKINLAAVLEDEMVIYIPVEGEEVEESLLIQTSTTRQSSDGKININSSSIDELQSLPGIGPAKASAIIQYRDEHGPFKQVEDLLQVSGIGAKSLEKMVDKIYVK